MEPITLGICMDGCACFYEDTVRKSIASTSGVWTYLEIGVAIGRTLHSVESVARDTGRAFRCVGVDLPNGWSTDVPHMQALFPKTRVLRDVGEPPWWLENGTTVCLVGSEDLLTKHWCMPIDLAMVDGCHERECAARDFTMLEPFLRSGSVVLFHDADKNQQGAAHQPHRGRPLEVYNALCDLGLVDNTRDGYGPISFFRGEVSTIATVQKL